MRSLNLKKMTWNHFSSLVQKRPETFYLYVFSTLFVSASSPVPNAYAESAAVSQLMNPFQFISGSVYFFLLGFFCYWILVLRPREVEQKAHKEFIEKLEKGAEVITSSGISGKVVAISAEQISLEIATNTKIKIQPEHILPLNKDDKQPKK